MFAWDEASGPRAGYRAGGGVVALVGGNSWLGFLWKMLLVEKSSASAGTAPRSSNLEKRDCRQSSILCHTACDMERSMRWPRFQKEHNLVAHNHRRPRPSLSELWVLHACATCRPCRAPHPIISASAHSTLSSMAIKLAR